MSTLDFSWTVAIPRELLPADLPAFVEHPDDELGWSMALSCALITSSTNDWLHYSLRKAVEGFGRSALAFLAVDPQSLAPPLDVDALPRHRGYWTHGTFLVSVLEAEALAHGEREVEAWLAMAASQPSRWAALLPGGYDADDVRDEARRAVDLLADRHGGGDGDHPLSLFSFLKGLRSLMARARAQGWSLGHVRFIELSGE